MALPRNWQQRSIIVASSDLAHAQLMLASLVPCSPAFVSAGLFRNAAGLPEPRQFGAVHASLLRSMERRPTPNRLVIGIGNPLRGDDGVGPLLAEEAGGRSVHQLTPELAEEIAPLQAVLFIDAWLAPVGAGPELLAFSPSGVEPAPHGPGSAGSHRLEPEQLLAACEALYGCRPRGHLLRVPGFAFGHGAALSAGLRESLPLARGLLRCWTVGHA